MSFDDLPDDVKQRVADELASGETVTWAGRANPTRMMLPTLAIMLFAIPWTAFAVFWTGMAFWMTNQAPQAPGPVGPFFSICFPLFGLPFIAVGIGMMSAPYWMRRLAARTVYVVTNRRAILFQAGFQGMTVRSFGPDQLKTMYRTERADGSGDIVFREIGTITNDGDRQLNRLGFFGIPEVRYVEELLKTLAASEPERPRTQENG